MDRCVGLQLAGNASDLTDIEGKPIRDDTLLILMNSSPDEVAFPLPAGRWAVALDTATPDEPEGRRKYRGRTRYALASRSIAILIQTPAGG